MVCGSVREMPGMLGRKEMSLTDGASGSSRAYLRAKPARPEFIRDRYTQNPTT